MKPLRSSLNSLILIVPILLPNWGWSQEIDPAVEEAFRAGRDAGYREGYEIGYRQGKQDAAPGTSGERPEDLFPELGGFTPTPGSTTGHEAIQLWIEQAKTTNRDLVNLQIKPGETEWNLQIPDSQKTTKINAESLQDALGSSDLEKATVVIEAVPLKNLEQVKQALEALEGTQLWVAPKSP